MTNGSDDILARLEDAINRVENKFKDLEPLSDKIDSLISKRESDLEEFESLKLKLTSTKEKK